MSTRYRGRHRSSRRKPLSSTVVGTGLVLPTTATLAVVAISSQQPGVALASNPSAMGQSAGDEADAGADLVLRRASEDRVARDAERGRLDVVAAENARRAAQETALSSQPMVEVAAANPNPPVLDADTPALPAVGPKAWVKPVASAYVKSSPFGPRWGRLHAGQDFGMPVGTPLRAMSSGVVTLAQSQGGYGLKVEIEFWDGTVAYYGHNSKLLVKVGQKVVPGQVVALSGNTGHSTGPHLHLEIHPKGGAAINPMPWLIARGLAM